MQEEWIGKSIAKQFAAHITKQWTSQGEKKSEVNAALEVAIKHFYGTKEAFFKAFLKKLQPKQLQQFYALLYEYLREYNDEHNGIDPRIIEEIGKTLREAGVEAIEQADASATVSPSTGAGKPTPGRGGNRGY